MKIQMVQVYTELGIPVTFQIAEMLFVDAGKELLIKSPSYEELEVE